MVVLRVLQLHLMDIAVSRILVLRECEVQQTYRIDIIQVVVPRSLGGLLADGVGSIVDAAVLEVVLLGFLHLDDKAPAVVRLAIDIEHGPAVSVAVAQMFAVEVLHIHYLTLAAAEQGIEEANQQVLVQFGAKQLLEPEVGVRVDVSLVYVCSHVILWFYTSVCKDKANK